MRKPDYMRPWDELPWEYMGASFVGGMAIAIVSLVVGFMLGRVL